MKKITLITAISLWVLHGLFAQHIIQENHFDGDIHFGFNMVRTFKMKGRRY